MHASILPYGIVLLLLPCAADYLHAQEGKEEFIRSALEAAPERISGQAAVVRIGPEGKTTELRKGTNGFTCSRIPDESLAPVCADEQGWRWLTAAFGGKPKPGNTQPGIAYMAKGGVHYVTPDDKIVMAPTAETRTEHEPPHWMVLWPVDPAKTALPSKPNPWGAYVMFAGTPFAHLMIHQDPNLLK